MDTILLEDFLAVLEEGGFSRAADRRAVSQPAFSRRIQSLEAWVGTPLFDRNTHAVRLTAAGERFRPVAEELLRRLQAARQEAVAAAQAQTDTLRFASTHALSLTFFPTWLRQIEAAAPSAATVQLTADNMIACEKIMLEGRAQFLLCHDHPASTNRLTAEAFTSIELGRDVLVPVAACAFGHRDLSTGPFLAYTSESGMGRILHAAWAATGRSLPQQPIFSSHLASIIVAMAREGRGIAWSPLSLVEGDLNAGTLVRVGDEADEVPMQIRLFRPKARQAATAEAFWKVALKHGVKPGRS